MIIILCTLMAYCLARAVIFGSSQPVTLTEVIRMLQALSTAVFAAFAQALGPHASSAPRIPLPTYTGPLVVALLLPP